MRPNRRCPNRQWLTRHGVLGSALLAWLALSAAPSATSPAASSLAEAGRPASTLSTKAIQNIHCDADCLGQLRQRLLELHRERAPIWLL
ncbi:hypothetical protein [Halomonas sp. NO4]|uniref:hypothetical protein n=1 Tax=Halomonas sp. NO4 TaxID=2484813 RepID=UPI0013D2018A|nr:hypothetical protein [Halomonas sp. NO4]